MTGVATALLVLLPTAAWAPPAEVTSCDLPCPVFYPDTVLDTGQVIEGETCPTVRIGGWEVCQ
jgi:hypothetical protein